MKDPFETEAENESKPEPAIEVPVAVKPAFEVAASGEVVVTLKGGTGYDAPWIVIHEPDVESAARNFSGDNAGTLTNLMDRVHKAAAYFAKQPEQARGAQQGQRQQAPAPARQAPAGAPECPGEGWEYKSGFAKASGKPWQAWMPPKGSTVPPLFF